MKALLIKDSYVIWKQMKFFLLIILVFSAIPSSFNNVFAIVYASMLPYTALAYDERSKWDQLAAMMPYSERDIVLSKYVFGWLCIAAAAVLSTAVQLVIALFWEAPAFSLTVVLLSVCCGLCILAITLPLMFRFGVEKGRMGMFLLIFLVCGSAGAISSIASSVSGGFAFQRAALPVLVLAAVALTAASVPLSQRFFKLRST